MGININCIYNDRGAWCKNITIRRSLFGFGARCCALFPNDWEGKCSQRVKTPRPKHFPPPPPPKKKGD